MRFLVVVVRIEKEPQILHYHRAHVANVSGDFWPYRCRIIALHTEQMRCQQRIGLNPI